MVERHPAKPNLIERVCLVVLLLFCSFVLLSSPLFSIREVQVEGNKGVAAKEITGAARIPPGENIFRVNLKEAAVRVKRIPAVKEVVVTRCLPNRIRIKVWERNPVAFVPGKDGLYALDEAGVCIGRARVDCPLPVVTGTGSAPAPGKSLTTEGYRTAVMVLKAFDPKLTARLAEVHVTPYQVVELFTSEGVKVYFGRPEKLTEKGLILSRLLDALGNYKVAYIDLKVADRPVVKFITAGEKKGAHDSLNNTAGYPLSRAATRGPISDLPGY
ncbi:cell division protein FtsQ/DivIB [Thermodesulfitimonas sp.]